MLSVASKADSSAATATLRAAVGIAYKFQETTITIVLQATVVEQTAATTIQIVDQDMIVDMDAANMQDTAADQIVATTIQTADLDMIADTDAASMQDLAAETAVHQVVRYVAIPIAHAAQAIASKFQAITITIADNLV